MIFGDIDASLHHVGIAVSNMKEVDLDHSEPIHDPTQKVNVSFTELYNCPIEFIEPASEQSPISNDIKNKKQLVHLCFEVPQIQNALLEARKNKCIIVAQPTPATAFNNRQIAWVYHKHLGLIELVEKTPTT